MSILLQHSFSAYVTVSMHANNCYTCSITMAFQDVATLPDDGASSKTHSQMYCEYTGLREQSDKVHCLETVGVGSELLQIIWGNTNQMALVPRKTYQAARRSSDTIPLQHEQIIYFNLVRDHSSVIFVLFIHQLTHGARSGQWCISRTRGKEKCTRTQYQQSNVRGTGIHIPRTSRV